MQTVFLVFDIPTIIEENENESEVSEALFLILDEREKILLKTVIKHRKKLSNGNPYASLFYLIEIYLL